MGYGGNLIWTSAFKALAEREKRPIAPVHLAFPEVSPKNALARLGDAAFFRALSLLGLRERFERWVLARATAANAMGSSYLVHVDMRLHSYAAAQTRRNTVWKNAPRAASAMLDHLGGGETAPTCEMFFDAHERALAARALKDVGVSGPFVAFEPDTNRTFFGDLRAWPIEFWQAALTQLGQRRPDLRLVQLGTGTGPTVAGAFDLRGRTSFRVAALVLAQARLFVGTESGLMHAAQAVGGRALILWGGLTLPEFIGYPQSQRTLCKYVACAPCGNNGWCDNGRICMRGISVEEVVAAMVEELETT